MRSDNFFYRLGDALSLIVQRCSGNRYPTRYLTRKVARDYRNFRATSPEKPEALIVHMVVAWRMSETASLKTQTRSGYSALLKELTAEPQSDLKKVTVSMLCIEHGLDERCRSEMIDQITRMVEYELDGVQKTEDSVA